MISVHFLTKVSTAARPVFGVFASIILFLLQGVGGGGTKGLVSTLSQRIPKIRGIIAGQGPVYRVLSDSL